MAAFTLRAMFGNRKDKKNCGQPLPSSGLRHDDDEKGTSENTGTDHLPGMIEYTTSPVPMLTEKEMKTEHFIGYFITIFTMVFVVFLILGYMSLRDIPFCDCVKYENHTEYGTNIYTNGTFIDLDLQRRCKGVYLNDEDERRCEDYYAKNEPEEETLVEKTFSGDCKFTFMLTKYGETDFDVKCNH